ncbi:hypothetical protein EV182_005822, partial [Spiromyces aspiralis]
MVVLCLRKKALRWFSKLDVYDRDLSWSEFKQKFISSEGLAISEQEDGNIDHRGIPTVSKLFETFDGIGLKPHSWDGFSPQELSRHRDT